MPASSPATADRFASGLTDWMLLGCGVTLLALALITPAWLTCRHLAAQRDLMRLQTKRMTQQQARYQAFYHGLKSRDPVLLQRLAFIQLGYKPVGKELLERSGPAWRPGGAGGSGGGWGANEARRGGGVLCASVDRWLLQPMPRPGVDLSSNPQLDTPLTRLTRHPATRIALIGAGLACVIGGLWPRRREVTG